MTKKALARAIGFDPSYISHLEAGRHQPSEDFARRADQVLEAGGQLWATRREGRPERPSAGTGELFVDTDHAELRFRDGAYTARMRRRVVNGGAEPVGRYLVRISVDRYPGRPDRSNELYRRHPLTWEALNLTATCDGEPMRWSAKHDKDSFKEVWLCFDNEESRFPLYPGQAAVLEYAYTIGEDQWGQWFQRAIRLPTNRVSVDLVFPSDLCPDVWGTETSSTAEAVPLRTPVQRIDRGQETVFSWSKNGPPIGARYRLEWRWRSRPTAEARPILRTASDRMAAAGIIQEGDPVLTRTAARFRLPEETDAAREVVDQLHRTIQRVRDHHEFGKGMGLAAPQVGTDRAAAVVVPPDPDAQPLVLLSPRIIDASAETDEQYEGCLSFFDVRGLVPRPRRIEVERMTLDGTPAITVFSDALARLVAHEVDHLHGTVYTRHMREDVVPIPVAEYRGTGRPWHYRR
ncbi:peptide deformylase [Allosalinactinospora lopnorensis]|uniref:peptide deformylase n=1 Tax=Allosalinactinospora lopnorensis TaxID=1352348 RepID=UPI0009E51CC9|nr:peptide deformylase [Allosalinactinospora lopnorensis]